MAQAQRQDPDIVPVMEQLSQEWKKTTSEELQSQSRTARAVWGQFILLHLKGVYSIFSHLKTPR